MIERVTRAANANDVLMYFVVVTQRFSAALPCKQLLASACTCVKDSFIHYTLYNTLNPLIERVTRAVNCQSIVK